MNIEAVQSAVATPWISFLMGMIWGMVISVAVFWLSIRLRVKLTPKSGHASFYRPINKVEKWAKETEAMMHQHENNQIGGLPNTPIDQRILQGIENWTTSAAPSFVGTFLTAQLKFTQPKKP